MQNQKSNLDSLLKLQKINVSSKEQEQKIYELDNKIKALFDEGIKMRVSFIRSHPDSYVSVTELSGLMVVQLYPVNLAKPLYEALSTKVKNSAAGLYCLKEIQARSKLTAGNYLPNFQADDMNNKPVALNDFKNNFVLLDFWASWCVPCREAIPHLKQAYTQYHSRDFEIIAISLDRNKDQWKKAIQADRTGNWVHVLLGSEMKSIFEPIQAIPQQILLDRSGKILWSSLDNNTSTWTEILENQIKDGSDN